MRKIALAKLNTEEIQSIQKIEAAIATSEALCNNVFIDSKEKEKISKQYKKLYSERTTIYRNITLKYKLPIVLGNDLKLSYDNNELYINATGE